RRGVRQAARRLRCQGGRAVRSSDPPHHGRADGEGGRRREGRALKRRGRGGPSTRATLGESHGCRRRCDTAIEDRHVEEGGESYRRQIRCGQRWSEVKMIRAFRHPVACPARGLAAFPAAVALMRLALMRLALATVALTIGSAAAQGWPTRTVRVVVPLTAGS